MIELATGAPIWALGLMSGTSMDGVDAALVLTDGETVSTFGPSRFEPLPDGPSKDALATAMRHAHDLQARDLRAYEQARDLRANRQESHANGQDAHGQDTHGQDAHGQDTHGEDAHGQDAHGQDAHGQDAHSPVPHAQPPQDPHQRGGIDDPVIAAAASVIDAIHRDAVAAVLAEAFARDAGQTSPRVIGFHGQTIAHAPEAAWTWQIGDGGGLASVFNRPVVWDFRSEDMRNGGEGAPLAPFFHHALARHVGAREPVAFLNIGGVANVTWVDPAIEDPCAEGALVAFDTGPGNALIDDWMRRRTGARADWNGASAASGTAPDIQPGSNAVAPFLDRRPPKSLDRNTFDGILQRLEGYSTADGAAWLTDFTADCIARAAAHFPAPASRWLVCGGGARNPTLMRALGARLGAPVDPVEAVGLDGGMLEAQAFAYLAVRVLRGLPTSAPSTTGCAGPTVGGRISHPAAST